MMYKILMALSVAAGLSGSADKNAVYVPIARDLYGRPLPEQNFCPVPWKRVVVIDDHSCHQGSALRS